MRTALRSIKLLVLVAALLATMGATMVMAQDGITGYVFETAPIFLEETTFHTTGATGNVRAIPDTRANTELFRAQTGSTVEKLTEPYTTDEGQWVLVRVWNTTNEYAGYGWMQVANARFGSTLTASQIPTFDALECSLLEEDAEQLPRAVRFAYEGSDGLTQGWAFDIESTACNLISEGRVFQIEQHEVFILRDAGEVNVEDTVNGFHLTLEASYWTAAIDRDMAQWAEDFAVAKHQNMLDNDYEWPIIVHDLQGETVEWQEGFGAQVAVSCPFTEPTLTDVSGIATDSGFSASVGAHACMTIAVGQLDSDEALDVAVFEDAQDNFAFVDAVFWVFPTTMTDDEVLGLMDQALFDFVFDRQGRAAVGDVFTVETDNVAGTEESFEWTMPRNRPGG